MIYCRNLNIIFVKTTKVGGTSFEIALSKYCDGNDIVTPIIQPEDEYTRANLGYQRPVNYEELNRSNKLVSLGVTGDFRNHMTAGEIRRNIGNEIFSKSTKISIHRDPIDFVVSLYWYHKKNDNNKKYKKYRHLSLREWLADHYFKVKRNYKIAPIRGLNSPDIILDYATLVDDIKKVSELPSSFLETFISLRAKGDYRPHDTKDPIKFLKENNCEDFIPKIIESSNLAKSFHK